MAHYGIGELTAPTILCELGDVTRLSAARKAVRCAGLDVGVHRSGRRSRAGKLTRQGSPQLRWALDESAQAACRPTSPDRADYLALKARGLSHTRASLDDRPQARPALLPHPARARPRRLGARHLIPPIRSAKPTSLIRDPLFRPAPTASGCGAVWLRSFRGRPGLSGCSALWPAT